MGDREMTGIRSTFPFLNLVLWHENSWELVKGKLIGSEDISFLERP